MSQRRTRILISIAALIAAVLVIPTQFTVVDMAEQDEIEESEAFNAETYVAEKWEAIESTLEDRSVDLATVLNAIQVDDNSSVAKDDLIAVTNEYGLITPGEAHVYAITGMGTVASVDTTSSRGTLVLTVDGYDGPIQLNLEIGPRLPSGDTSIRDAVGIDFNEFTDQTEYGQVSSEINGRVRDEVLALLDFDSMEGSRITVTGAMTIRTFNLLQIDLSEINVIPFSIETA